MSERADLSDVAGAMAQDDVDAKVDVVVSGLDSINTTVPTPLDGQVRELSSVACVPVDTNVGMLATP